MPRKHRPSRLPLLLLSLIAPFCVQPAQAQGSVTLQPDGSLLYSGDAARFSIGYSKGGKFQGELSGVLHEQANSAWLGEGWVAEMNRLGMVIDASHASDEAFDQMLELSSAPLILSHSGTRGYFSHPRNLDDDRIRALVAKGGVIGFTTIYLSAMHMVRERASLFRSMGHIGDLSIAEQADLARRWNALAFIS